MEGKTSNGLMQAQSLLWTHTFNHIDSMSLKCAVELGIPDAIHSHGKPISLSELRSVLSIPPAKAPQLRRLMRILAHTGIFLQTEEDTYSLTPVSALLVEKKDFSLSGFLLAMLNPIFTDPFQYMSAFFKSHDEPTPFSVLHGCGVWGMTERNPAFNKVFNDGMESDAKFVMSVLVKECGSAFEGVNSLVDVGGGTGSAAVAISEAFPTVKCSVLDLPQVVDGVKEVSGSVDFIAGDMFEYVPPADAVFLKWILHDWNDDDCVKILKQCKEAIPPKGGKVIIVDLVMNSNSGNCQESRSAQLYWDMMMMVLCGGAERGEDEWQKIFFDAGFKRYKITPALGLRSVIEVYP